MSNAILRLALPSKGRLEKEAVAFLEKCAMRVRRENERQYQAKMTGIRGEIEVMFQRAEDIPALIGEGHVDLGITGYDLLWEKGTEGGCISIFPDERNKDGRKLDFLPYGACALVLAVQDHWVHVTSVIDLADLAVVHKKKNNKFLRVATEFPNLTKKFLFEKGVFFFEIVDVSGAAESAPRTGSADIVSTLTSSGVTLTENRLKQIIGGTILKSSGCLIASSALAKELPNSPKLNLIKTFVDRIEAHVLAEDYVLVTANVVLPKSDAGEEEIRKTLRANLTEKEIRLLGREGPTVADVVNLGVGGQPASRKIYSIGIQVRRDDLDEAITILRSKTGRNILVNKLNFVFDEKPYAFQHLLDKLQKIRV